MPLVRMEQVNGVGVVTLDRPHRHNAINDRMHDEFCQAMRNCIDDSLVRCILLRGEGRSFCSGRDTAELGNRPAGEDDYAFVRRHQRLRLDMIDCQKPMVAAVQGSALGGGFELALCADMRIIAEDAVFGLPEVGFGLVPDTGGTQVLPTLVGPSRAKYLVLTGARIDAATGYEWGLAEEVVTTDALHDRAMELCLRLAAQPALASMMAKALVNQSTSGDVRNGITQELLAQTALFRSDDYLARMTRPDAESSH